MFVTVAISTIALVSIEHVVKIAAQRKRRAQLGLCDKSRLCHAIINSDDAVRLDKADLGHILGNARYVLEGK